MILFCACAYSDIIPQDRKTAVLNHLYQTHPDLRIVADLCGMASRKDPLLAEAAAAENLVVVACHPRAIQALFDWAGVPLVPERVRFVNLRASADWKSDDLMSDDLMSDDLFPEPAVPEGAAPPPALPIVDRNADWIPWFPVIDRTRCIGCRQCLEFCLFGVYEIRNENAVTVVNPAQCKTNCPACARLCPEAAILFPKFGEGPISGEPVTDETAARAAAKAVAEGDLRTALEERQKRRRALLKPEYPTDAGKLPS